MRHSDFSKDHVDISTSLTFSSNADNHYFCARVTQHSSVNGTVDLHSRLLHCPGHMVLCPLQTDMAVSWCQWSHLQQSSGIQAKAVELVTHVCLETLEILTSCI